MALPATDAFTSASDQTLTAYSASWTNNGSSEFTVLAASDDVGPTTNVTHADEIAHWNADTFADDQYALGKTTTMVTPGDIGPAVRVDASAMTAYVYSSDSSASFLGKYVAGAYTQLGSNGSAAVVNDILKVTVVSTTVTPYINSSTTGTPGAQTDSAITSGSGGIYGYRASSVCRLDDWEGGDVGGSAYTVNKSEGVTVTESAGVNILLSIAITPETTRAQGVKVR